MNTEKVSTVKKVRFVDNDEKSKPFPKKDLKRKRVSSLESDSDSNSSSFDTSSSSDSDSKSKSSSSRPVTKKRKIGIKSTIKPKDSTIKKDSIKDGSRIVTPISIRAIAHQMSEFKQQFEQKMTRLELLLKEGFKAVADCSVQIEKLRSDMNLPE